MGNFCDDLAKAKKAEKITLDVLSYLGDKGYSEDYVVSDVSDIKEYWHKGDLIVTDKDGGIYYVDVKDDSRIGSTRNILCEDRVFYRQQQEMKNGFMHSDYNYLAVVSQPTQQIYIINFDKLKKHYRKGKKMEMHYSWQYSIVYLLPLDIAYKYNMVEAVIDYDGDESGWYPTASHRDKVYS